jgi:ribulose-5-phosphate 4-epimerase/fuculose-1-phosphate aldolase
VAPQRAPPTIGPKEMAMKLVSAETKPGTARDTGADAAQWQMRVDLAAAHRLAHQHGFSEGIFNHLTCTVPGKSDRYFQIPFGTHWTEVTASVILEVGYDGKVLSGEGEAELSGYCIHAPIHRLNPEAVCVMHTHMPFASALARLEDPTIKPIGQTECGLMRHVVYDELYTGPAFDPAEGERLARVLGDKKVMFMANHGVLTVGRSVAEAYDLLYYLERVAQVQLYAMWTGQKLKTLPQSVIEQTMRTIGGPMYGGKPHWEHHFAALKRMLDRREPDYKD